MPAFRNAAAAGKRTARKSLLRLGFLTASQRFLDYMSGQTKVAGSRHLAEGYRHHCYHTV